MAEEILSNRELRRYNSQINLKNIGQQGQEKLKLAKVLVVGSGGKGTFALTSLITAGVGYIGISDDKLVQEETLCHQNIFSDNDIGKQKAIVSKQYLRHRNQFTEIKVHNIKLTSDNLELIVQNYDLIIDTTDNFDSHIAISTIAKRKNKPLLFSTVHHNKAIIIFLNFNKEIELKDILNDFEKIDVGELDDTTPKIILNAIIGTILANETIRFFTGNPSQLSGNRLIVDMSNYNFQLQAI